MRKKIKRKIFFVLVAVLLSFVNILHAQDLLSGLDSVPQKDYASATFKTTRLINVQTLETLGKRTLDFRISHRFGSFNSGSDNFWGLDGPANIRLGLEYSYDGRLMAGIGRSSYEKMLDGFLKYKFIRQANGGMPLSMTLYGSMFYITLKDVNKVANGFDKYQYVSSRMSYVFQVIIGRKFNSKFSFQAAPVMVHYNLVEVIRDKNDMYAVSFASRYKFTKRMAFTAEYTMRVTTDYSSKIYYDSFGLGLDVETGGHVFQMHLTNSFGISDNQFIPHTDTKWDNVGIRLGFNISRVFTI